MRSPVAQIWNLPLKSPAHCHSCHQLLLQEPLLFTSQTYYLEDSIQSSQQAGTDIPFHFHYTSTLYKLFNSEFHILYVFKFPQELVNKALYSKNQIAY